MPQAMEPSGEWVFPGVILAAGWAGLHGIRADLETPFVVAFYDDWLEWPGRENLSPDGQWFAMAQGQFVEGILFTDSLQVNAIVVYSTDDPAERYTIEWDNWIDGVHNNSPTRQLRWWDEDHLIYQQVNEDYPLRALFFINPFSGEIRSFTDGLVVPSQGYFFYPSPDWTRAVVNPFDDYIDWSLQDLISGETLISFRTAQSAIADWKPDSSGFMMQMEAVSDVFDWYGDASLVLVSREGTVLETVFEVAGSSGFFSKYSYYTHGWSADGRYFAFVPYVGQSNLGLLYIADTQDRVVINTCIMTGNGGLAWSPDGAMLSFLAGGNGQRRVEVLEISSWQLHSIAFHDGRIIGWRE